MLRACLSIAMVALLSAGIVHLRDVWGGGSQAAQPNQLAWVRTVDGWEPSAVLTLGPPPAGPPTLHPAVVATLQLGVSLFALLALPSSGRAAPKS